MVNDQDSQKSGYEAEDNKFPVCRIAEQAYVCKIFPGMPAFLYVYFDAGFRYERRDQHGNQFIGVQCFDEINICMSFGIML